MDFLTGHPPTILSNSDHSEADTERPLVSISLGLTSVFVAGGRSRDERKPVPFLLKSGDVILMSGPSRRIYHGAHCSEALISQQK